MKISSEKKSMIKSFARNNSNRVTAKRFEVCPRTVGLIVGAKKVTRRVVVKTPDPIYFRHEDFTGI